MAGEDAAVLFAILARVQVIILKDLKSLNLSFIRYYLKSNMETETLCSDEDAQDLLREGQISLLQLSTVEVATQLSMRAFELFCAIEPTEYIEDLFKLRSKTSSASLKRFEEAINHETFWVATEVTREPNQLKRMKTIKHFIKIALHCRECKNFNSMFAIIRWAEEVAALKPMSEEAAAATVCAQHVCSMSRLQRPEPGSGLQAEGNVGEAAQQV